MNIQTTAFTCAYVIMELLTVSYGKICSVMRHLRSRNVNEKHHLIMVNCVGLVRPSFIELNDCTFVSFYFNTCTMHIFDWLGAGRSRDRIPVGAGFSAPVQTGPGAHATSIQWVPGLPGVKRPGLGVHHPPHLAPRLKKE